MTHTIKFSLITSVVLLITIVIVSQVIISFPVFTENGSVLSTALTFDLIVFFPLLYLTLIWKTSIPKATFIPVFVLSFLLASFIIPTEYHLFLDIAKYFLTGLEFFVGGYIIYKIYSVIKSRHQEEDAEIDFSESLRRTLYAYIKNERVSNILTSEISIFYYALLGWNRGKETTSEELFTYHSRNGFFQIVGTFIFLIVIEAFAIHLLLMVWSNTAAWIFSGLSLYGLIFLVGDINAVRKRPIYADREFLYLRIGIRWYSKIPISEIEKVRPLRQVPDSEQNINLVLMGDPNTMLTLKAKQKAIGLYGISRSFESLSISIDDADGFIKYINEKL